MGKGVKILGPKIRAIVLESALPVENYAHSIGMQRSGLSRLINAPGVVGMHGPAFIRLAEYLKITTQQLRAKIGAPIAMPLERVSKEDIDHVGDINEKPPEPLKLVALAKKKGLSVAELLIQIDKRIPDAGKYAGGRLSEHSAMEPH